MTSTQTTKTPTNNVDQLQNDLKIIHNQQQKLIQLKEKLQLKFNDIDNLLTQQDKVWTEHGIKYNEEFVKQLEDQYNLKLSDEEKSEFTNRNFLDMQEKITRLQKLAIKIPKDSTNFMIAAYDIVATAQQRSLQKPENIVKIVTNLKVVGEEKKASAKLQAQFAQDYQSINQQLDSYRTQILAATEFIEKLTSKIEELKTTATTNQPTTETSPSAQPQSLA